MTADDDIAARLQLINTEGIGPVGFKRLLARFGSAEEALRETAAKKKVPSRQWAEEELERRRRSFLRRSPLSAKTVGT